MLHRQLSVTAVFLALRSKHWEDVEDLEAHLTLAWRSRSGALIRSCCHGARALETELTGSSDYVVRCPKCRSDQIVFLTFNQSGDSHKRANLSGDVMHEDITGGRRVRKTELRVARQAV